MLANFQFLDKITLDFKLYYILKPTPKPHQERLKPQSTPHWRDVVGTRAMMPLPPSHNTTIF